MLELKEIKATMDRIKTDIAVKEGERKASMQLLERDFGIKDIDAAYDKLDDLQNQIDIQTERKAELIKLVNERLKQYGY